MAKKKSKKKNKKTLEELISELTLKDLALANRHINRFKKYLGGRQREISEETLKIELELYLNNRETLTIFTAMCISMAMREKDKKFKHKSRSMESYIKYRNRPKSKTLYTSYC